MTILSLLSKWELCYWNHQRKKCHMMSLFLIYAKLCVWYWPEYFLGSEMHQLFCCLFFRFISLFSLIYLIFQTCYLVVRLSPAKLLYSIRGSFMYLTTKPLGEGYLEIWQFFLYKRDCNFWAKLKWSHLNPLKYMWNMSRIRHSYVWNCYVDGQWTVR